MVGPVKIEWLDFFRVHWRIPSQSETIIRREKGSRYHTERGDKARINRLSPPFYYLFPTPLETPFYPVPNPHRLCLQRCLKIPDVYGVPSTNLFLQCLLYLKYHSVLVSRAGKIGSHVRRD